MIGSHLYNSPMMTTIREEVYEVIREMPGIRSGEIVELMPYVNKQTVYATLNLGYIKGELTREGVTREDRSNLTTYKWTLCEGVAKPPMPKRKAQTPENDARVGEILATGALRKQIAELEAWKADAIARYPDLAVPPLVKRARELVAEMLRSSNDHGLADQVVAGTKDGTMMMRGCVAALEESM